MTYNKFRQLYHVIVSHEFGGVTIHSVFRKDRAEKLAAQLEAKACGESIFVEKVL